MGRKGEKEGERVKERREKNDEDRDREGRKIEGRRHIHHSEQRCLHRVVSTSTVATHIHLQSRHLHRSEEHTSELQSRLHLVCRLLLEKKKRATGNTSSSTAPYYRGTLVCWYAVLRRRAVADSPFTDAGADKTELQHLPERCTA